MTRHPLWNSKLVPYEDMVKMAYKDPDRIASIRQIVEKADETVIPDHFMEMYNTFENVIKQIKHL